MSGEGTTRRGIHTPMVDSEFPPSEPPERCLTDHAELPFLLWLTASHPLGRKTFVLHSLSRRGSSPVVSLEADTFAGVPRRRTSLRLATGVLSAVLSIGILAAPVADATAKPRVFANCAQLNAVYPHGVGKIGAHDKGKSKNFRPVTTFTRNTALYQANIHRDGDKDGVACEKR
jgi:hypothetical protein